MKDKKKNKIKESPQRRAFIVINYIILIAAAFLCLFPFVNLLATSFSSKLAVVGGHVTFWPVDFTTSAYEFIMKNSAFWKSLLVAIERTLLGVTVNVVLIVLTAYPLSKSSREFAGRTFYSWFFVITMLFNAGLIPTYLMVKNTGLIDSIWALILPGALPVYSMLVVMNYMRSLPKELEEAAYIDGAGFVQSLVRIVLPVSKPTLATVTLFSFVNHWNSWFDGMIYMNSVEKYPLQSYLQTVVINPEVFFRNTTNRGSDLAIYMELVNAKTSNAAQLFLATIPILCVYPFLQKYFTTGLVMGSVKG